MTNGCPGNNFTNNVKRFRGSCADPIENIGAKYTTMKEPKEDER